MALAGVPMTGRSSSMPTVSVLVEVTLPSDTLTVMPKDLTSSALVSEWSIGPDSVTV